jgi:hypothetical protein
MKRLITVALSLSLSLVGAQSVALAQLAGAPGIVSTANGDCVTSGSPGDWTITCGDLGPGSELMVVSPPVAVDTVPASTDLAPAPAPAPEPAPVAEPVSDTSGDAVTTETAVATETDRDADNYADALEAEAGLDPTRADTDADHVADGDEFNLYQTDPTVADTDGDGALDGEELFGSHTDPLLWDDVGTATSILGPTGTDTVTEVPSADVTVSGNPGALAPAVASETDLDADNYADAQEWSLGLDPRNPDTDGDRVADGDEINIYRTEPTIPDTDGDGHSDGEELFVAGTDPLTRDSNGVGEGETDLP